MNVGAALRRRCLRLDADKAAGNVSGVEDPVIGIAAEDRRNLFLGGKLQKGGLVEACPNDSAGLRLCSLRPSGELSAGPSLGKRRGR